jgi:hypothetical protein
MGNERNPSRDQAAPGAAHDTQPHDRVKRVPVDTLSQMAKLQQIRAFSSQPEGW